MSDLIFTVTTAGRAALVNADNTGTAPVLVSHCGVSPVAITADPATTAIPAEIKRISTLAGDVVADDTIHVTVRDESADVYSLRSIGLYLADGTLFAVYSQSAAIMEKSAQAMLLLTVDIQFPDIDATSLTFGDTNFLNPTATTERQGVVELATDEETAIGADSTRAVSPKGVKSAVTGWLNDRFGAGAPSSFVKGLLALASATLFRQEIGLGNVDNTSDVNKPISNATQNALNTKADAARTVTAGNGLTGGGSLAANRTVALGTPSTITTGTSNSVSSESHTHALTIAKADIGLGNVDNTSDVNKPISNATQNALSGKTALTSANRPGVTRLYRRDEDSNFSVQIMWDGGRWFLRGYQGDAFHAEARVAYADYAASAGGVAWGNVSGRPTNLSAFYNDPGYINAEGRAYPRRVGGGNINFNWSGQAGQPLWLWGGNDGDNMYVYNPSNFSVAYAANAGYAGGAGNSDTVDNLHASDFVKYWDYSFGSNANGYWRRTPDGVIEQWGTVTGSFPEGGAVRYFPIQFTDVDSINLQVTGLNTNSVTWNDMWTQSGVVSLTQFIVVFQSPSSGNQGLGCRWRAIGK